MRRSTRWIFVGVLLAAATGAPGALANQGTPLWGWNDAGFSLWPVLYVGQGGFSVPGLRWTDHSFSVPLIHYQSEPQSRFDLTPVYHHSEGQDGFFLGPERDEINDGEQGVANLLFDLTTLLSNTRPYLSDDHAGYETYREYGRSDLVVPGSEDGGAGDVSLARKIEEAPPEDADAAVAPAPEAGAAPAPAPEQDPASVDTM